MIGRDHARARVESGGGGESWSDSDDDSSAGADSSRPREIYWPPPVTDHPFSTYQALCIWIVTKQITFAALSSTPIPSTASLEAGADASPAPTRRKTDGPASASSATSVVSLKSVYRLAHQFEIPVLKRKALAAFRSGLTVDNAAHQL